MKCSVAGSRLLRTDKEARTNRLSNEPETETTQESVYSFKFTPWFLYMGATKINTIFLF